METFNNAVYSKVLGQVLRTLLTILAAYLRFVGVDEQTRGEFVATTVNIVVPVLLVVIIQIWGVMQKRYETYMTEFARTAPPHTTTGEIHDIVTQTQSGVVSF